jgi:3-oxoacyl-[acyl-carrier-protein] synthase-3
MKFLNTVITGTGSYIPEVRVSNEAFGHHVFFAKDESAIETDVREVISKFRDITGIEERRYAPDDMRASDLAFKAAERAIADAKIDRETIDQIVVAQDFGDIIKGTIQTDAVPSLASRVKHMLGIENPSCIPYDVVFGCPGWLQGIIQADSYIKSGLARRCLVIGAETLSRVIDKHDRDCMIFADGAGAAVVEGIESDERRGILSCAMMSHAGKEAYYLYLGKSNAPGTDPRIRYIKMNGRRIYEYSLQNVPVAMKAALDKSGVPADQIKKIVIHQANEKMDEAILARFLRMCDIGKSSAEIMPMNIHTLGNSSVATIPTLYDMILKGELKNHEIRAGDVIIFASVGAGMNINAVVYRQ